MIALRRILAGIGLVSLVALGCGPAKQASPGVGPPAETKKEQGEQPGTVPVAATGPTIEVSCSAMADLLHLAEGVSLWQAGMSKSSYRAFEARFGLDATDRELQKKFSFARSELLMKSKKAAPQPTFDAPFGPEGLFPPASASFEDRFWEASVTAAEPKAVGRALAGILEPADAEAVAAFMVRLAPRAEQIVAGAGGCAKSAEQIASLLRSPKVMALLGSMGALLGIETKDLKFQVHPVWVSTEAPFEAVAYGDRILVTLPEGKPVGVQQAALVVHEIGRRLLARVPAEIKALGTMRYVEVAGYRQDPFLLVEGLLDALSHGLAAPALAAGPADVPSWPGDAVRQKLAEALTPVLREAFERNQRFDGVLALKVGELQARLNPPRPADFVNASMVIAEEDVLAPFKSQVVRWTVWKFPPSKDYNYPKKLDQAPGRSVLLILKPKEIKSLPERFAGVEKLLDAFKKAHAIMNRKAGVIIATERESRGWYFLVGAHNPEAMKLAAKAFFALDHVPSEVVEVE